MTKGRVTLAFGPPFSGKTSFALGEDFPVDYHEFEPGGFRRASSSIPEDAEIKVYSYRTPLTNIESTGTLLVGGGGGVAPAASYRLEGWLELYAEFLRNYIGGLKSGGGRPVIDTGTKLWLTVRQAFNQQLQEATGNEMARLDQIKYTEPNARITQITEAAERFDKDLIIIAHEDRDFNTGAIKPDTYKNMADIADISLRFEVKDNKPVATIFKIGEGGLGLIGLEIVEPTISKVNQLLDAAAILRRNKVQAPKDVEAIIAMAEAYK